MDGHHDCESAPEADVLVEDREERQPAAVTLAPGATADVTYTVKASTTGSMDSDWGVTGHVEMDEELFPQPDPAPVVTQ